MREMLSLYERRITATSQVWNTFISIVHIYFNNWHWVQIVPLCYCPLRNPGKCGLGQVRLGYLTPYQRLRLYNVAPFSRLLRHPGDTEDVFST